MATVYGFSSFNQIHDQVLGEFQSDDRLAELSPDNTKQFILDACRRISDNIPVKSERTLRLIQDQEDYLFSDSTVPATGTGTVDVSGVNVTGDTSSGTGTISTSDTAVTGVGTLFTTELAVGKAIIVGSEVKEILSIESATALTLRDAFDDDIAAGTAFTYTSTKFKDELVIGSQIVVNSETRTIDTITSAYQATVTAVFTTANNQSFTIDTVVTEIPTKFISIDDPIDRLESSQRVPIYVVPIATLLRQRVLDATSGSYNNLTTPICAALWRNASGRRYLKFYKAPEENKEVTIRGNIKVFPLTYASTAVTADIPLSQEFDQMVVEYVKSKVARTFLKDREEAAEHMTEFWRLISEYITNMPVYARVQPVLDF